MRMTFTFTDQAELATASKFDLWQQHVDFPDKASTLPDVKERLQQIAHLVGELTEASLFVDCDTLSWKHQLVCSCDSDWRRVEPYRTAVLGFETMVVTSREKYKYLKILFALAPPIDNDHYKYPQKALVRKVLNINYPTNTDDGPAYLSTFDQLAEHCLSFFNANSAEPRKYLGFHPRWMDKSILNQLNKRIKISQRDEKKKKRPNK
jgi:hypothetical protein